MQLGPVRFSHEFELSVSSVAMLRLRSVNTSRSKLLDRPLNIKSTRRLLWYRSRPRSNIHVNSLQSFLDMLQKHSSPSGFTLVARVRRAAVRHGFPEQLQYPPVSSNTCRMMGDSLSSIATRSALSICTEAHCRRSDWGTTSFVCWVLRRRRNSDEPTN
jgi:hypothetical protein